MWRSVRRTLAPVVVLLATSCGGSSGGDSHAGGTTGPPTPVLTTLSVALGTTALTVGGTTTATASGLDQNGAAIGVGTVVWAAGTPSVASVTSSGLVTAVAAGTTTIVATAGSKQAQATLTVTLAPVANVAVTPSSVSLAPGNTQQFAANPVDASGVALTGRTVSWTTSDAAKVTVTSTGLATGVTAGTATISATSEGKVGTAAVTVTGTVTAPSIASIAPTVMTPGTTATITGTNFSATPSANAVTIDGVASTVTAASATQLSVTVPNSFTCSPTHAAAVRVTVAGQTGAGAQSLRVGTLRTLSAGGSAVITSAAELSCMELPAGGGDYIVSVFDNSQTPTSTAPFRLAGTSSAPSSDRAPPTPVIIRQSVAPRMAPLPAGGEDPLHRDPAMHQRELDMNRAVYPMVHAAFEARRAQLARSGPARNTAPLMAVTVGTTRAFRVNQFSTSLNSSGGCTSYKDITARVVYVGTRAIMWEDVTAPLAGTMDATFTQLGQEFDATMYRSDSTYFGDPLVTDPQTDNDQHLNMVFTPAVPTGLAGFVISCDLVARDAVNDPSSNFGEFFYAVVPTVAGTDFNHNTPPSWLRSIRTTVVHEVKHISSIGARLTNGATSYEESWLEEGLARMAEELWLRNNIYHAAWKANSPYATTLYCDVRPTFPQCTGAPYGMYVHYTMLATVLENPGASSLFGRVADNDFNFYAMAWSFARWAADRYAGSDTTFFRGITQATTTTGTTSIAIQTGQTVDQMLGDWVLSQSLDDVSAFSGNADVQITTWNSRDLYSGMHTDFPTSYPATPLVPVSIFEGTFSADNAGIHGGAFATYELSGNSALGQTVSLLGVGGVGAASTSLRIAIGRIQ